MHASRLLIVEDHPILADALRMNVLQLLPRVQCLLAYDLASGLEMLLEHSPIDLVVLDLNLPDSQGVDTLNAVCQLRADGPLMVFSSLQDPALPQICLSNRVSYLCKSAPLPQLMSFLLQSLAVQQDAFEPLEDSAAILQHNDELAVLSNHQRLVLSQLAHGKSCAEIAGQMNIAESTVRSHMHAIYRRLGVVNKSQASTRYWLWAAGHGRGHH